MLEAASTNWVILLLIDSLVPPKPPTIPFKYSGALRSWVICPKDTVRNRKRPMEQRAAFKKDFQSKGPPRSKSMPPVAALGVIVPVENAIPTAALRSE